jgi:nucleoside diphosphate kinase
MGTGASGGGILRFLTSSGSTGSAVEERMRINNSGRVMIGTTTATSSANLTVKESLAIQSGSNTVLSSSTG